MSLSYRLKLVTEFVPVDASYVADIGADHGLVCLELLKSHKDIKLFASDNKIGPYNRLKDNLSNHSNIILSLSDGLDDLPNDVDTLIISGMGGKLIVSILKKGIKHLNHINYLILSPHNDSSEVRRFLYDNGYVIEKEEFLKDSSIYYSIILFKKGYGTLSHLDEYYGPIIRKTKNESFKEYINKEINRNKKLLSLVNDVKRLNEIENLLKELENI